MGFGSILGVPLFLALIVLWLGGCVVPFVLVIRDGLLHKHRTTPKKYRRMLRWTIVAHVIPMLMMLFDIERMVFFVVNEVILLVIQLIMIRAWMSPRKQTGTD